MGTRGLTAGVITEVTADGLRPAIFVELIFDVDPARFWTGYGSRTFNGDVYEGAGSLLDVAIEETAAVEARGMRVTLSGLDTSSENIADSLGEPLQGRPMRIHFAVLSATGAVVADAVTFQGRMDTAEIDERGSSTTITFTGETVNADFRPATRRWTPEDQAILFPDDKGFEFVASLQDARVPWGFQTPI